MDACLHSARAQVNARHGGFPVAIKGCTVAETYRLPRPSRPRAKDQLEEHLRAVPAEDRHAPGLHRHRHGFQPHEFPTLLREVIEKNLTRFAIMAGEVCSFPDNCRGSA
jgi:hypothetical protein